MPSAPSRRSRLWRVLAPAVFALAGLLFATSFQTAKGTDLRSDRGLPGLIESANREVAGKAARISALEKEVEALTGSAGRGDSRVQQLTAAGDALAAAAGAAAVQGPGLRVTLSDSTRNLSGLPPTVTADDLVVHQQDVQAVVNALWRGGAEAMMIQDQRVIATSAVRCVGNTLILQGRVYSPPFVVTALGRIDALREALDRDEKITVYQQWVDAVGLGWEVSPLASVRFPAYSGSVSQSVTKVVR